MSSHRPPAMLMDFSNMFSRNAEADLPATPTAAGAAGPAGRGSGGSSGNDDDTPTPPPRRLGRAPVPSPLQGSADSDYVASPRRDADAAELAGLAAFVNQNLQALGYAARPLDFRAGGGGGSGDQQKILQILQRLLQQRKADQRSHGDARARSRKLEASNTRLASERAKLQTKVRCLEQDVASCQLTVKQMEKRAKRDRKSFEQCKSELEKRNTVLSQRDTSYQAKLRKQEVDYDRLKQRLSNVVAKGGSTSGSAASRATRGSRLGRKAQAWAAPADDQARLRVLGASAAAAQQQSLEATVIRDLEEQQHDLRAENDELRGDLAELHETLRDLTCRFERSERLLRAAGKRRLASGASSSLSSPVPAQLNMLSEDNLQISLPLEWIRHSVVGSMKLQAEALRNRIDVLDAAIRAQHEGGQPEAQAESTLTGELHRALDEARAIIVEQDSLIQRSMSQRRKARRLFSEQRKRHPGGGGGGDRRLSIGSNIDVSFGGRLSIGSDVGSGDVCGTGTPRLSFGGAALTALDVETLNVEMEELATEKEWLAQERQSLEASRKKFEAERDTFTRKMLKLGGLGAENIAPKRVDAADHDECPKGLPGLRLSTTGISEDGHGADEASPVFMPVAATPGTTALLNRLGISSGRF